MKTSAPRGTADVTPDNSYRWHYLEEKVHSVCRTFGYREVRTPVFEHTELFERGVGETTDVVQKEMYTFQDKGGRSITLRPEGTAGAVRSFLEHGMYGWPQPVKMYYLTSCYRYEKPQAGRLREFHQFGIEAFGSRESSIDAEVIALALAFLKEIGVTGLELRINSAGCPVCRAEYGKKLVEYLQGKDLCETCQGRLERNPIRVLDCKSPICGEIGAGAPRVLDYLCPECEEHFNSVKEHLKNADINYMVDNGIVRGLDYYTKTVFEIVSNDIGAQGTVCGGGRYDGLVEELGGKPTPGIGFGLGLERALLVLDKLGIEIPKPQPPDVFIASIGREADLYTSKLVNALRLAGVSAERNHIERSVKSQMKYADKLEARNVVVIGEEELNNRRAKLRNMSNGEEKEVNIENADDIKAQIMS